MPNPCIAKFPPIAKMINLKSHSICILNAYNYHRIKLRIPPIASGPLKFENRSLVQAKKEYSISNKEEAMLQFLSTFNSFKHYSMVAYPVGLHQDHFKHGKESLENKIVFCFNPNF